jgi:hypothetical protein
MTNLSPRTTFNYQVMDSSMAWAGMKQGAFVLIDTALEAEEGDVLLVSLDGSMLLGCQAWDADGREGVGQGEFGVVRYPEVELRVVGVVRRIL